MALPSPLPSRRRRARLALAGALLMPAALPVLGDGTTWHLRCAVFYTPARQVWQRSVDVTHDGRRIVALQIDGVSPYAYAWRRPLLLTAVDNERIAIDLARGLWHSDFRGRATGDGPCTPAR